MTAEEFQDFRHRAVPSLTKRNERCERDFCISAWSCWDFDLDLGTLIFSRDGAPGIAANMVVVGSTSTASGSWLWSWANNSIPHSASHRMSVVRFWGDAEGITALTTAHMLDDEYLGWEFAAIAARLLDAKGPIAALRVEAIFTSSTRN